MKSNSCMKLYGVLHANAILKEQLYLKTLKVSSGALKNKMTAEEKWV